MWRTVTETSTLTFHGGFLLLALATAAVIASVTLVSGHPVAKVLSIPPLPYLGRISYGMYLWYLPVLLVMTSERTHLQGVPLLAARHGGHRGHRRRLLPSGRDRPSVAARWPGGVRGWPCPWPR